MNAGISISGPRATDRSKARRRRSLAAHVAGVVAFSGLLASPIPAYAAPETWRVFQGGQDVSVVSSSDGFGVEVTTGDAVHEGAALAMILAAPDGPSVAASDCTGKASVGASGLTCAFTQAAPGFYELRILDVANGNAQVAWYALAISDVQMTPASAWVIAKTGGSATLSMTVAGGTNLSYQWQRYDGAAWQDVGDESAVSTSLAIPSVAVEAAGDYRLFVTDTVGVRTATLHSPVVHLDVQDASSEENLTLYSGLPEAIYFTPGSTISWTVHARSKLGYDVTYAWESSSDALTWSPVGSGDTYTFRRLAAEEAGKYYRVIASDGHGNTASATARLTLRPITILGAGNIRIAPNASATMAVRATSTNPGPLTYAWFEQDPQGRRVPVTGGSGADTPSYMTPSLATAGERVYVVQVTDGAGNTDEAWFFVHVSSVAITRHLTFRPVMPGAQVTLTVGAEAADGGELTYEWSYRAPDSQEAVVLTPVFHDGADDGIAAWGESMTVRGYDVGPAGAAGLRFSGS